VDIVSEEQHSRLHPHKFTLWVTMASMIMMFAGLTSAFIVKSGLTGWRTVDLPKVFWVSTVAILVSSVTIQVAVKAFKNRNMQQYRKLIAVTLVLGVSFLVCQIIGFSELWDANIRFKGSSGAGQFFYAIAGLHALHVVGGIVALAIMLTRSLTGRTKTYSSTSIEVMGMYWHFVDFLWLYLLIFFLIVG